MTAPLTPLTLEAAKARQAAAELNRMADLLEKRGKWTRGAAEAEVKAARALEYLWPDTLADTIDCRVAEFDLEPADANGFPINPATAYFVMMPDGSREWMGERL